MVGKTLGHYEISAPLGRGGMGEVYQAKDRKLGRDVAIKVLPEEFARDAYAHLSPSHKRSAVEALGNALAAGAGNETKTA